MNESRRMFLSTRGTVSLLTLWWVALAVVSGVGATAAQAASLSSASSNVFCSVEGNTFMHPTQCEFGGGPGVPSSALAEVLQSVPSVFATASRPTTGALGAGASATLLYRFQVVGPSEGELVPILMDTYLFTEATFESKALARMIVSTTSGVFEGFEVCTDPETCEASSLSETIGLSVRAGSTLDSVTLYAEAQARVNSFGNEVATATADPYIYINPAFPNAHLYSVVVSPGVGNAPLPPVPEPATIGLMAAGLGWLWWCRNRPRRVRRDAGRPRHQIWRLA